jgi:hypothetical protein
MRGAAETSYEVTHVPDPLHLAVDGGITEDMVHEKQRKQRERASGRALRSTPMA